MKEAAKDWFVVNNVSAIDSPALLIYRDRVKENIRLLIRAVTDINILRPHVKTSKIAEVCRMVQEEGINKFKCATIAEAEMLGLVSAKDVLFAYQPVGPKIQRLIGLIKKYPATSFSCLTDNRENAADLSARAIAANGIINIFIDINTGMNRTGIHPDGVPDLFKYLSALPGIKVKGLHIFDGHIRERDIERRQLKSDEEFEKIEKITDKLFREYQFRPIVVIGGSPTFPTHLHRVNVECSPGTFIFWDHGYKTNIPEQPFDFAALVITRIISIVDAQTICTDLGYKSIASENPAPRVFFLNAPGAIAVGHSEEHLVLKVENALAYKLGDVLYGVPTHICPTVALYEKAFVIENQEVTGEWKVIARDRKINI
jgi:D-serine deaminase-like pyridoxal phosphate-dependent protein